MSIRGFQPFTILHIPHSSVYIPGDVRESILLSDEELALELLCVTDWYTDELFQCNPINTQRAVYPVSRLVADPERFLDDSVESMSKLGMGAVYTKTSAGRALRAMPTDAERIELIGRFYEPHHRKLELAVSASLSCWGLALIIDCHSFPSRPLPFEVDQSLDRPDICIGTDPFHTPDWLVDSATDYFCKVGLSVAMDRPFWGSLVPGRYYAKDNRVVSIMLEVKRSLYMDEKTGEKNEHFPLMQEISREIMGCITKRIE